MFDALNFSAPNYDGLGRLSGLEWRQLIHFSQRTQLAIPFALACQDRLPAWAAECFHANLRNNAERWRRLKEIYREASEAFQAAGLEFVTLKGFTHAPWFVSDPRLRVQYDLDLLFPREQVFAAREVALSLGYEPLGRTGKHPVDHLPTLIRKTGWEWRGDYFDPDHPPALELHFRLWDAETEGFALPGLEHFWARRQQRTTDGVRFTSLAAIDLPGYAAAHALRHLLRGDSRPAHFYELAYFLEHNSGAGFWHLWREMHDEPLRRVQAICFAIAREWFGCRLPAIAREETEQLPHPVRAWLAAFAHAPAGSLFRPTKDELWLHLSLVDAGRSRLAILRRRLLPLQLPGPIDAVHLPDRSIGWWIRVRRAWRYSVFLAGRIWRHALALAPTLWSGAVWVCTSLNESGVSDRSPKINRPVYPPTVRPETPPVSRRAAKL